MPSSSTCQPCTCGRGNNTRHTTRATLCKWTYKHVKSSTL